MTLPVATRRTDPATSLEAARAITASGERETQCTLCLRWVQRTPGLTGTELGGLTLLGQHEAVRRLNDLRQRGQVAQGVPRRQGGRRQLTWWPVLETVAGKPQQMAMELAP